MDRLVSAHLNDRGLFGFVQDGTLASVMLSKALQLVDRQRIIRRMQDLANAITSTDKEAAIASWLKFGVSREEKVAQGEALLSAGAISQEEFVMAGGTAEPAC